ncbi:MAG: MoaD/ThiS family protein [Proteobacteria bacterium]|nr:MoaD/ThiS family protein [Pseudomonadota bacterium]
MIKVLLFGTFAKEAGSKVVELEAKGEGQTLGDIIDEIRETYIKGDVGIYMMAVNEEQATPDRIINDGDEVAIMPPFSGG